MLPFENLFIQGQKLFIQTQILLLLELLLELLVLLHVFYHLLRRGGDAPPSDQIGNTCSNTSSSLALIHI